MYTLARTKQWSIRHTCLPRERDALAQQVLQVKGQLEVVLESEAAKEGVRALSFILPTPNLSRNCTQLGGTWRS